MRWTTSPPGFAARSRRWSRCDGASSPGTPGSLPTNCPCPPGSLSMPIKNFRWFIESLTPEEGHLHGIRRVLFSTHPPYQSLDILELGSYGKALVLDGKIQSSLLDEFIYHESLVHPAMLAHPAAKRVFIVGGGEGATLREVLRHPTVERVLMVDIDEEVVNRCKEFLPEWHKGSFDDPRAEVRFLDARRYLEETQERFDVIIIDISEPVEEGPACIPCFALPWGFSVASKRPAPRQLGPDVVDPLIADRITADLRYYDGLTHPMSFLPPK